MKNLKPIQLLTLLGLLLTLALYYRQPALLESFEAKTYDLRVSTLRTGVAPSKNIAIVTIDDKSIAELGQFPWPRQRFRELLDATSRAGAKAVLFDVIFPEKQSPTADADFAEAVRRSKTTVLAEAFEFAPDGTITGCKRNTPVLLHATDNIAHINIFPDDDGVIRWGRLAIRDKEAFHYSLGFRGAMALLGGSEVAVRDDRISVGGRSIPVDPEQRMLINYSGSGYEKISFVDVIKGRVAPERLQGRVLFVGATAIALYDMRITPFSNNLPGVEINAHIADNIVRGDFIKRGTAEALLDLLFIILFGLLAILVTLRVRHGASLPLVVVLSAASVGIACLLFRSGSWVSIVYPIMSILLSFSCTAYLRFFFLERKAREIRSMFSCYVSRRVVDELVKNPELARVGGEEREITIMFADVRNYTTYSENRSPVEVVRILNEYLAEMTGIILKHDGTLDKFLGDGILAYWNAPLHQENHAELAVQCAAEMMQRMPVLQERWRQHGDEPLSWGIGLNIGKVIVGTIGAEGLKMEYTAIGDNVNLTYRIQNEGRDKKCPVVTRALYERVKDLVEAERMGEVYVKGKAVPIEIFALHNVKPASPEASL